jgi:hypothetical protein
MHKSTAYPLHLPPEFEDLTGVVQNDLKVMVSILTDRASERLLLSRRQSQLLRRSLWEGLTRALNEKLEPLSVERR